MRFTRVWIVILALVAVGCGIAYRIGHPPLPPKPIPANADGSYNVTIGTSADDLGYLVPGEYLIEMDLELMPKFDSMKQEMKAHYNGKLCLLNFPEIGDSRIISFEEGKLSFDSGDQLKHSSTKSNVDAEFKQGSSLAEVIKLLPAGTDIRFQEFLVKDDRLKMPEDRALLDHFTGSITKIDGESQAEFVLLRGRVIRSGLLPAQRAR